MKNFDIEPCCQGNNDDINKRNPKAPCMIYKRPEYLCPCGYDIKWKKKKNAITRLQDFLNRPIDRKIFKPTARTRQLALPKVRKILSAKEAYDHIISDERKHNYKALTKKSLFTIYSRLGKVSLPAKEHNRQKWSEDDWKLHDTWLELRAKPKFVHETRPLKRKNVPLEKLRPLCEELSEPKHLTEKFNPANTESFTDPITKPKITSKEIDYASDPWYQYLNLQLEKLKEYGLEKQREIEEIRNPKPLPPLKKVDKENICEPVYLSKLLEPPNKTAMKALEDEERKKAEAEEHYRKTVDRKFLQIPPSEVTQSLARSPNRLKAFAIHEKEREEAELERYKRACGNAILNKEHQQRLLDLTKIPQWITDLPKKEQEALQLASKQYQNATNRKYLKQKPRKRIQELAVLTDELLPKHRQWFDAWLQRDQTYKSCFTPKRNALKYKMPKNSRLRKLSMPRNPKPKIEKSWM